MKNYKKMLENASNIQYLLNVIGDDYCLEINHHCGRRETPYVVVFCDYEGKTSYRCLTRKEWLFLAKGRTLRSGLATPMARYYAWKALNRKEGE